MKTFYCGDTHFNHANIAIYSNRPFIQEGDLNADRKWVNNIVKDRSVKAMDAGVIAKWNSVVTNEDTVYHVGDFAFCRGDYMLVEHYLKQLNFKYIYFVYGNHDEDLKRYAIHLRNSKEDNEWRKKIKFLGDIAEIITSGQPITLCHYAMKAFPAQNRGGWMLYGHSHGMMADDPNLLSIDVGIDCHDLTPISFEQVEAIMSKKTPAQQHEQRRLHQRNISG